MRAERHEIRWIDGLYWCLDENVNSDECTDYERCSAECVCNDRTEGGGE